jgi:hypothetical protein
LSKNQTAGPSDLKPHGVAAFLLHFPTIDQPTRRMR